MKLVVFLQGTTLIESGLVGKTREECVKKSRDWALKGGWLGELIPIGESARKVGAWSNHVGELYYLTASRKQENVTKCEAALRRWSFPPGTLLHREGQQSYSDVISPLHPDLIVEDDCESLGGTKEMVYPNLAENVRRSIASVVVREFEGIDHLADDPTLL